MVKWSWVLVTSTHVIDLLKCASVVWAAWLVPITPCSNQSAQTAITGGWDGCAGLKTVKEQKGRGWEWQNLTSRCNHILNVGPAGDNCLKLLLQGMKYLHLQGSGTGSNSHFAQEINHGFRRNKLQLYVFKLHQQRVIGAKMSLPCKISHCKRQQSDKRHNSTIIRPTIQHPCNNRVTAFVLQAQLNVHYVKLDSKCCKELCFDTREFQIGGFEWIFSAVCVRGNSPRSPNRWGQESRAKGQDPQTLREDTDTSKGEVCCLWRITKTCRWLL